MIIKDKKSKRAKRKGILLATHYLDISGSSTFLQTLAHFLQRNRFEVYMFGVVVDSVVKKSLIDKNIHVVHDLEKIKNKDIRFIIGQHNIPVLLVRYFFPNQPLIFVVHGILSQTETPPSIDVNVSHFIAISEEVKQKIVKERWAKSTDVSIIRNFVDTQRFKILKPIKKCPKEVLFLSSRYTKEVSMKIERACAVLRINLTIIGKGDKDFFIEKHINKSDIVVSLGRGVLESMSCGRPVVIFDYQGGDGMVTERNYLTLMKKNFSGRTLRKKFSLQELVKEFKKYDETTSERLREIILEQFNVELWGQTIIDILEGVKATKQTSLKVPYKEIKWLIGRINYFADLRKTPSSKKQ